MGGSCWRSSSHYMLLYISLCMHVCIFPKWLFVYSSYTPMSVFTLGLNLHCAFGSNATGSSARGASRAILTCISDQIANPGSAGLHSCTNRLASCKDLPPLQLLIPCGQPTRHAEHGKPPNPRVWRSAWGPDPSLVPVGTWNGRAAAYNPGCTGPHSRKSPHVSYSPRMAFARSTSS